MKRLSIGWTAALMILVGCPSSNSSTPRSPVVQSISPATGGTNGGLQVTIGGSHIHASATVTVGGILATGIVVVSSQQITATTPPGFAGPADVVVTNPDSRSGTLAGGFTYFPPPGGNFTPQQVVGGLSYPISIAFAPDWATTDRIFFTEKNGEVHIIQSSTLLPQPFVTVAVDSNGDRGLMGIVFDPDYANNSYVYIFYDDTRPMQRIVRYEDSSNLGMNPTVILDDLPTVNTYHNAGNMAFGPDGMLYVTLGDDGNPNRADDLTSFDGKILRLNRDGTAPPDNPWYDGTLPRSLIYARGLRNSFDLGFHPLTGDLYATENGPGAADEVNLIQAGGHYGWDSSQIGGVRSQSGMTDPVDVFNPEPALTGIAFNTGYRYPEAYFGDAFIGGWNPPRDIYRVDMSPPTYTYDPLSRAILLSMPAGVIDVAAGPDGYLYVATSNAIYRIEYN
ncbi:MAG: PQQ-dependent sugar dehydrogenase [Planctomycetota bacterium]|nr:PQQ-dependent sugar dehydrogenase [Planctomycetota bacterium]